MLLLPLNTLLFLNDYPGRVLDRVLLACSDPVYQDEKYDWLRDCAIFSTAETSFMEFECLIADHLR